MRTSLQKIRAIPILLFIALGLTVLSFKLLNITISFVSTGVGIIYKFPTRDAPLVQLSPVTRFFGFRCEMTMGGQIKVLYIEIPYWLFGALLVTMAFAVWLSRMRQRVRRRKGLCALCGFDLRASVDFCPECGAKKPSQSLS